MYCTINMKVVFLLYSSVFYLNRLNQQWDLYNKWHFSLNIYLYIIAPLGEILETKNKQNKQYILKCVYRIMRFGGKKRHSTLLEGINKTTAVWCCGGNILVLHFIISNPVVNRQLMLLYIPLITAHHNSSWHSQVKYIPLCWHYLLFFVSYKWFVTMLWILVTVFPEAFNRSSIINRTDILVS